MQPETPPLPPPQLNTPSPFTSSFSFFPSYIKRQSNLHQIINDTERISWDIQGTNVHYILISITIVPQPNSSFQKPFSIHQI